ncbi:MAG: CDP-alcohol phosphatidyltransferase family protein [Reyranellaceae bacterium]
MTPSPDDNSGSPARPAVWLVGDSATAPFGIGPVERLRRSLRRHGVDRFLGPHAAPPDTGRVLLARGDRLFDDALARDMVERADYLLLDDKGVPVAANVAAGKALPVHALLQANAAAAPGAVAAMGLAPVTAGTLGLSYRQALRKREDPFILDLNRLSRGEAERRLFMGAYKGVTDFVTKYVWPLPALWVTRFCAANRISPNMVTLLSLGFVLLAMWLFSIGWFGPGLIAAWIMTFLDTVDGKLARVTLTSSGWGEVFDHGIDHVHPPFWWAAWWWGLVSHGYTGTGTSELALWIVVGGYVVGRLQEGLFLLLFKFEMHAWQKLDSRFRLITQRRNPNLFILSLFTIAGAPQEGFLAVAIWTVVSLAFHFGRIAMAFRISRRDGGLTSWLARPAPDRA